MSSFDFNNAETQRTGELIPDGEVCQVHMTVRPGGAGEGGWLKRSKSGEAMMIDAEFTVIEGRYERRKFWTLFTVDGETEGQLKAVNITRSRLRAMLESARNINPADESPAAIEARRVHGFDDFDGLRFLAVLGIEKGTGDYKDKNVLKAVVTPDRKNYLKIEQLAKTAGQGQAKTPSTAGAAANKTTAAKAPAGNKPSWAA